MSETERVFTFPSIDSEARGVLDGLDGWCGSCRTPAAVEQMTRTKDVHQARGSASADKGPGEQGEGKVGAPLWFVLLVFFPQCFFQEYDSREVVGQRLIPSQPPRPQTFRKGF